MVIFLLAYSATLFVGFVYFQILEKKRLNEKTKNYTVVITYRINWNKREYLTIYIDVSAVNKKKAIEKAVSIALEKPYGIGLRSIDNKSVFES